MLNQPEKAVMVVQKPDILTTGKSDFSKAWRNKPSLTEETRQFAPYANILVGKSAL